MEKPFLYEDHKREIQEMFVADQQMRRRSIEKGGVIEIEEDDTLDFRNTERMKQIIHDIGWPTISKVGAEISNDAWLLVQHADHDVTFQKKCLDLMKQQSEGEVSKRNIAYLEDRIRVNEGQPQLYGTQFRNEEGTPYGPCPIEDPEHVNDRRKEMGMELLEEYTKIMLEKYKPAT